MFSSNQKLNITGECSNTKYISSVIKMLMEGYEFNPRYYYYDKIGYLHLKSYVPESEKKGVKELCEEDLNVNYVVKFLELYFESSKFNNALNETFKDFGDGGNYKGWELNVENNGVGKEIIIKPFWAFYHK